MSVDGLGKVGANQLGAGFAPVSGFAADDHPFQRTGAITARGVADQFFSVWEPWPYGVAPAARLASRHHLQVCCGEECSRTDLHWSRTHQTAETNPVAWRSPVNDVRHTLAKENQVGLEYGA